MAAATTIAATIAPVAAAPTAAVPEPLQQLLLCRQVPDTRLQWLRRVSARPNSTTSAVLEEREAAVLATNKQRFSRGTQLLQGELPTPPEQPAALSASPDPSPEPLASAPPPPQWLSKKVAAPAAPLPAPPSAPPSSPPNCEGWCLNFVGSSEKHCAWRECLGCADCPAASPSPLADTSHHGRLDDDGFDGAWPRLAPWRPPSGGDTRSPRRASSFGCIDIDCHGGGGMPEGDAPLPSTN